ncbi:MAG: hypothetical protein PHV34_11410 [Verrucomicrobiae bacterium]|nr:hypothetical protein [Verrucomicrobiae bacterium]
MKIQFDAKQEYRIAVVNAVADAVRAAAGETAGLNHGKISKPANGQGFSFSNLAGPGQQEDGELFRRLEA